MEIRDKVAIVTGGGSGIGTALAERFAAGGARGMQKVYARQFDSTPP